MRVDLTVRRHSIEYFSMTLIPFYYLGERQTLTVRRRASRVAMVKGYSRYGEVAAMKHFRIAVCSHKLPKFLASWSTFKSEPYGQSSHMELPGREWRAWGKAPKDA